MYRFLEKVNAAPKGSIEFAYHDNRNAPMPNFSDPLELLGDIRLLRLSEPQKTELRTILRHEIATEGPESIWRNRAFRKNVIYSFGAVV